LSKVLDMTPRDRRRFKKLLDESKRFESLPIRTRLTDTEVARFAAQRFRFPGVEIKARLFRNYPFGELASHVIGYIGRINPAEKAKIDAGDDPGENYRGTEYIGKLGIEQSYRGRAARHYRRGAKLKRLPVAVPCASSPARPPHPGNTVRLSIDIKLQKLG
jgi:penicillin-binding protein 2